MPHALTCVWKKGKRSKRVRRMKNKEDFSEQRSCPNAPSGLTFIIEFS